MRISVFCDTPLDYKYRSIWSQLHEVDLISDNFSVMMKLLFSVRGKKIYHIRYIKYRGVILTALRMLTIILLCFLSRTKIVWTCHNIFEHTFSSVMYNRMLRNILCLSSSVIMVFHQDIKSALPSRYWKKVIVANFGNMTDIFGKRPCSNSDFINKYELWCEEKSKSAQLITVSTAQRTDLSPLFQIPSIINKIIICPGVDIEKSSSKNLFIYNSSFVKAEVLELLRNRNGFLVGFIGHNNLSVATSLYMYASFGIPVICINSRPCSTIVEEYEFGVVIDSDDNIDDCYFKIMDNYEFYSNQCNIFIENNSWSISGEKHRAMIQQCFEGILTNE